MRGSFSPISPTIPSVHGDADARCSSGRQGTVVLTATDDGEGVSENDRAEFEPFFTTRRDTGGTGLGLGIVVALLKAHDGSIRLVNSAVGTRFEIELPAA